MEIADHIACLRSEGELLAEAAERSSLSAPVPACPGWRVRDLLAHLGFVHRWAADYVAEERTEMTREPGEEEIIRLAPADDSLVAWFRDGHARLVSVLAAADPAVGCWTFLAAPSPLAFWARRQAHETAIHRADAQLAAAAAVSGADLDPFLPGLGGDGVDRLDPFPPRLAADAVDQLDPFPPGLAADGVDELLTGFGARNPGSLSDAPATLVIRAEDGACRANWTVLMGQPRAGVSRGLDPGRRAPEAGATGPAPAYCEVAGPASALYLMLWNRGTAAGLDVRGDAGVLATWRENMRVRWH